MEDPKKKVMKIPFIKYSFPSPCVMKLTWNTEDTSLVFRVVKYVIANPNSLKIDNEDEYEVIYEGPNTSISLNNVFPGTYCYRIRAKKLKDRRWSKEFNETFAQIGKEIKKNMAKKKIKKL